MIVFRRMAFQGRPWLFAGQRRPWKAVVPVKEIVLMRPLSLMTVLCTVFLLNSAVPVAAADSAPTIGAISIGFDGRYKSGYWTPVHIELTCGSTPFRGDIQIVVPDGDGVATRFVDRNLPPLELAAGEVRNLVRLVKIGRSNGTLSVEAHRDGIAVARRSVAASELPRPLSSERILIAAYGTSLQIEEAIGRNSRFASTVDVCELSGHDQLPEHWLALEAVDVLVLTSSDLAKLQALSSNQVNALQEWVLNGGQLIWSVGKNARELLGEQGRFASLAPGKFRELGSLRNSSGLETFAGSIQPLELESATNAGIPLTILTDVDGRIELADVTVAGSRPLVVRAPFGFGQIVFVAFDLDASPVASWEGRSRIVNRLLQGSDDQSDRRASREQATHVARFGYQDMVGQLRSGLDQFPGVTFVAFSWVAGLVLLYLLVIVPVDYFFLRDVLRRMTLTWVTFPIATLLFVGLAIWLSSRWKGREIHLNQVDLIDVDVTTGHLRGTTWAHLYSPRAATYDLQCEPDRKIAAMTAFGGNVLGWQGLPGTGLGGLNTAAAAPPAIDEYQMEFESRVGSSNPPASEKVTEPTGSQSLLVAMRGAPVHIAATKSLINRCWGEAELTAPSSLTVDSDGLLRGEIVNPLPLELGDCIVYFENWAFRLDSQRGVLRPGQPTRIENERALNLQWRLTGRRVVESKDFSTPWDQYTLVVPRIIEMMMFHSAAGGETYTQLVNRYQSYVDLSSHLTTGRAILIGRSKDAAMNLKLDDKEVKADQLWTYYRILFPVATPRRS
jgi:hypothetical protein